MLKALTPFAILCFSVILISSCGGSRKKDNLEVPLDMPEICHDIDFDLNVEMRKMCGVKTRSYRAYKNVPQYRLLLRPKDGKIVKKGNQYELRLPKMLPVKLPQSIINQIEFSENARRTYLKSKWEYHEFFPAGGDERIKIMRIDIPLKNQKNKSVCYTILSRPKKVAAVQSGFASQLEVLECSAFDRLKPDEE